LEIQNTLICHICKLDHRTIIVCKLVISQNLTKRQLFSSNLYISSSYLVRLSIWNLRRRNTHRCFIYSHYRQFKLLFFYHNIFGCHVMYICWRAISFRIIFLQILQYGIYNIGLDCFISTTIAGLLHLNWYCCIVSSLLITLHCFISTYFVALFHLYSAPPL